jgi:peptide chain release factor subunit 1
MTAPTHHTDTAVAENGAPDLGRIDLRRLSELSAPERAFLSFYASSTAAIESLDDRARLVRAVLAGNEAELEHFEQSLAMLRERLPKGGELDAPGLALFACWALDFVEAYPLAVPPPRDMLWIDASPYVRPLAELQDEYIPFVVVAADNRSARIWQVVSARPQDEQKVRGDVKNRVKKGGWSQKRYQRRRDNELLHYGKDIAAALERLYEEKPFERLVLLGTMEILGEIKEALPKRLASTVVGERNVDLKSDGDEQIDAAFDLYFEQERQDEAELWERIRAEVMKNGGLAAAGPSEVLAAAQAGRVDTMIVRRDAKIAGMRCRECELLAVAKAQQCPGCKSNDVFAVDLVNELVQLLATTSARAEFTDPLPGLEEVGSVAALLRW